MTLHDGADEAGDPTVGDSDAPWQTILREDWPDFVLLSAMSNLSDMADATLSRTSPLGVMRALRDEIVSAHGRMSEEDLHEQIVGLLDKEPRKIVKAFRDAITKFLDGMDLGEGLAIERAKSKRELKVQNLLKQFLGDWQGLKNKEDVYPQLVTFDRPSNAFQRLFAGLHMMSVGAVFAERAGYLEDAAAEYLMTVEFISIQLLRVRTMRAAMVALMEASSELQSRGEELPEPNPEILEILSEVYPEDPLEPSSHQVQLMDYLLRMADFCLSEYFRLKRIVAKRSNTDYMVGTVVAESAVTAACEIILHASDLFRADLDPMDNRCRGSSEPPVNAELGGKVRSTLHRIRNRLSEWLGESFNAARIVGREHSLAFFELGGEKPRNHEEFFVETRSILNYCLIRHPFPSLNQVQGLRALIDDAALSEAHKGNSDDPRSWNNPDRVSEIYTYLTSVNDLSEQLQAPMHITPMEIGRSATLFYLRTTAFGLNPGGEAPARSNSKSAGRVFQGDENQRREAYRIARNALRISRESYTMGRSFRESISSLHYLFDDFNDRRLHTKHSLQMSDMEMCSIFERILQTRKK